MSNPRPLVNSGLVASLALTFLLPGLGCGTRSSTTQPAPPNLASPSFSAQPASLTVAAGSPAAFTASANGLPAPTFQWQRSNDGGRTWTALAGATGTSYTLAAASVDDNLAQFQLIASNSQGTAGSSAATLAVTAVVGQTTQVTLAPQSAPLGIATGPDGNIWFTNQTAGQIGVIPAVTHVPSLVTLPNPACAPTAITAGPDGRMWFTEQAAGNIGVITLDGQTIHEYAAQGASPTGIAAGPDGALWYTLQGANAIGRMTPAGAAVTFPVTTAAALPQGIALGQVDGNLYFTENAVGQLAQISTTGAVTEWSIPAPAGGVTPAPTGIVATADGALWFSDAANSQVVKFVPPALSAASPAVREGSARSAGRVLSASSQFTPVALPAGASPQGVTVDSFGNLWVANAGLGTLSLVSTTSLAVVSYALPSGSSGQAANVVIAPDGTLYVTQPGSNAVTQVTTVNASAASSAGATVTVAVSPANTQTQVGLTVQFAAQVAGNTDTQVTWTIKEGSAGGSITGTGLYTAPATAGTYHVVATSQADTTQSAAATVTVSALPVPAITSFSATPATLVAGASTTLTGVFANGIGVITPGNLTLVSGGTLTLSPTATTTYTLTVTNAAGAVLTQTATVTVDLPAPLVIAPANVTAGATGLTASVLAEAGNTYAWTITGGTLTAGTGTSTVTFTAGSSGKVVLTCTETGAAVSAPGSATCAIVPAPTITSFTPSVLSLGPGAATTLTAVFSAGTGGGATVTPGVGAVTSGVAVSTGNLAAPTTFTLTVTNAANLSVTATTRVIAGSLTLLAGSLNNQGTQDGNGATAELGSPAGLVWNAGNLLLMDSFNGGGTLRQVTTGGTVTTLAGTPGYGGYSNSAPVLFDFPQGCALDAAGNLFIADQSNHVIRRRDVVTGAVTTYAGTPGVAGWQDGDAASARFNAPGGVAVDGTGNVYVADSTNNLIRMISPALQVTTLAGLTPPNGTWGAADGPVGQATFNNPMGITVDFGGDLYVTDDAPFGNGDLRLIAGGYVSTLVSGLNSPLGVAVDTDLNAFVAVSGENRILEYETLPSGIPVPFAGTGALGWADGAALTTATFFNPTFLAMDPSGNLYVSDGGNATIRAISGGMVTTLAGRHGNPGTQDGTGAGAQFNQPWAIAQGPSGNFYIADTGNNSIRRLTSAGVVTTLAGSEAGVPGFADGNGSVALFDGPIGIAVDAAENVYVADNGNSIIRKVVPGATPATTTVSTIVGQAGVKGWADGNGLTTALLHGPQGVACDAAGNLYIADTRNHCVRKLNAGGMVGTIAGVHGTIGSADGPALSAKFDTPQGLLMGANGVLYIVDVSASTIRTLSADGDTVGTLAGTAYQYGPSDGIGAAATFYTPNFIVADPAGNFYVNDFGRIRRINPVTAKVETIIGTPGTLYGNILGPLPAIINPIGLALDATAGNLHILTSDAVLVAPY